MNSFLNRYFPSHLGVRRDFRDLDRMVDGREGEVRLVGKDVHEVRAKDGAVLAMAPGLANGMLVTWLGAVGREIHALCAKAHELDARAFAEYISAHTHYRPDLAPGIENALLWAWLRSFSLTDEWGRTYTGVWQTPLEDLPLYVEGDGMGNQGSVFRLENGGRLIRSACECGGQDPWCGWCGGMGVAEWRSR